MRFDDIDDGEAEGRFLRNKVRDVLEPSNPILANPTQAIELVGRVIGQIRQVEDGGQTVTVWNLRKHWLKYFRGLEEIEIPGHIDFCRTAMQLCDKMADRSLVSLLHGKTILGIGGQFSAGKSAFINAVLGLNGLLPEEQSPTTSIPTFVTNGEKTEYLLTAMRGRVTREISATELNALSHAFYDRYKISFSAFVDSCIISSPDFQISPKIVLLDTPGYSKPDDLERTFTLSDRERALEQLKRADRLIWLIQQENGTISAEDLRFITDVNPRQPILIVVTHADQVGDANMEEIIKNVKEMSVAIPGGVYGVTGYSSPLAKEYKDGHLIAEFLNDVAKTDNRKGDIVHQFDLLEQQILNAAVCVEEELVSRVSELKKYIANTTEVLAMRSLSILMGQATKRLKLVRMAIKQQPEMVSERKALIKEILAGDKIPNCADKLLRILSEVMLEDGVDKSTDLYLKFSKLDTTLRDKLYPALNRIGLGEGPDAVRFSRQMLERVETACRFPELTNKPVVKLIPPSISDAFSGKSLGLIGRIPEIGAVRTIIPILALHGPRLKIEYVNYADCRREITVADYGDLIKMSEQNGLWLNRLIKNFIVTSPAVTPWAAVLVVADRYENVPVAKRLSMYIGQTFPVLRIVGEPKLNPLSAYLGLREQFDWLTVQVRAGLLRDEQTAKRINHAVTEDRTRLMTGSEDTSDFFVRYQKEAKTVIDACKKHLEELGQILREAEIYLEDIRHLLHDVYSVKREDGRRRFKRLPSGGKKSQNLVVWCLCRIIETYIRSGFDPRDWYGKLDKFGISRTDPAVADAEQNGRRMATESYIDPDELVKEGERKIKARTSDEPLKPTDVQLVPYKMAAAFGNVTALSRLADIFYKAGRYSHGRRLKRQEEIAEAKALQYVLGKLVYENIDASINSDRIERIKVCLGEYDCEEDDFGDENECSDDWVNMIPDDDSLSLDAEALMNEAHRPSRKSAKKSSRKKQVDTFAYDENASYESTSKYVSCSSSGCFVVTAASKAVRVGRFEKAKAFLLMRRLKNFRMLADARGRVLLSTYSRVAPQLVDELDKRLDSEEIYEFIWRSYILPACAAARAGDYISAEHIYTEMIERLLFDSLDCLMNKPIRSEEVCTHS